MKIIIELLVAFIATYTFSILFIVPKSELFLSGLTGCVSWFIYHQILITYSQPVFGAFIASLSAAYMSKKLAYIRKKPSTIFLTSGIITLVPGTGVYFTMIHTANNQLSEAINRGLLTLEIAGAIALAIIIVFSLPLKKITK